MNKRLKELAMQAGISDMTINYHGSQKIIERFAELVRADEREACAKVFEKPFLTQLGKDIAAVIRARGDK